MKLKSFGRRRTEDVYLTEFANISRISNYSAVSRREIIDNRKYIQTSYQDAINHASVTSFIMPKLHLKVFRSTSTESINARKKRSRSFGIPAAK